ncbi:MAG: hypothetical protein VKP57_08100 [Candidatus Sericytochromatia bacterium]|nr:hypothetical protein [Candidatus Sericytochromatia bacterium]
MDLTDQVRAMREDFAPKVDLHLIAAEGQAGRTLKAGWRNRLSSIIGREMMEDLETLWQLTDAIGASLRANPIRHKGCIPLCRMTSKGIRHEEVAVIYRIEGLQLHAAPNHRWRYVPEGRLEVIETGECISWNSEGSKALPPHTLSREGHNPPKVAAALISAEIERIEAGLFIDTELWVLTPTEADLGEVSSLAIPLQWTLQRASEKRLRQVERLVTERLSAKPILHEMEVTADTITALDRTTVDEDEFLPKEDHLLVRVTGVRLEQLDDGTWAWTPAGHVKARHYSLENTDF